MDEFKSDIPEVNFFKNNIEQEKQKQQKVALWNLVNGFKQLYKESHFDFAITMIHLRKQKIVSSYILANHDVHKTRYYEQILHAALMKEVIALRDKIEPLVRLRFWTKEVKESIKFILHADPPNETVVLAEKLDKEIERLTQEIDALCEPTPPETK